MTIREFDSLDAEAPVEDTPVETVETANLLASSQIEGASVYGQDNAKIGHVYNFMVDKRKWTISYVVISDGGFLGIGGARYVRVTPERLVFDEKSGGYLTDLTAEMLSTEGRETAEEAELRIW